MLGGESKIEGEIRRLEEKIQRRSNMPSYPEDLDIVDAVKGILCELRNEQQKVVNLLNNVISVMEGNSSGRREAASPLDSLVRRVQFAVEGEQQHSPKQYNITNSSPSSHSPYFLPSTTHPKPPPLEMSMATYNYMQKYHLLDNTAIPPTSPGITKILDDDYIRQMPKL